MPDTLERATETDRQNTTHVKKMPIVACRDPCPFLCPSPCPCQACRLACRLPLWHLGLLTWGSAPAQAHELAEA